MYVVVNFDALAQASDFRIERRQVVFLCWMQDSNPEGLWNPISSRLNACWQTDWAIEDQAKNLNSTASPYDQQAFSPPDPTAIWHSHLALVIYIFVVVNFDALAQASDFWIERRQVVFLCWMLDSNPEGLWNPISSRLNACWQTDWAIKDQAKNLNSTARPYDQQAFSPPDPTAIWHSHLALAIYIFVVLRKHIVTYMERHGLFNPLQHGFRLGRSCLSQLIAHYDQILELLANGVNVDVVYIDFAKAFDKVDFMVTLKKLKGLGISGKVGKWIHSFLTNRSQVVLVWNARSQAKAVKSGVPQGSVLGPLLFLVLISDIDEGIARAFLSSFADDTRIGSQIASESESLALQADLCSLLMDHREQHGTKRRQVWVPTVWNKSRTPKQHLIQIKFWKHHPRKRLHQRPGHHYEQWCYIQSTCTYQECHNWGTATMFMDPQDIQYQAPHPNVDTVEILSPEQARLLQPTMVSFEKRRHPGSWNGPETIPAQDLKYAESVILAAAETTMAFLPRTKKREIPNYLCLAHPGRSSAKYKHSWTDTQDNSQVAPTSRKRMCHTYSEKDCSPRCKETLLCQFACTWTATLQHSTYWHPQYNTV